MSPPPEGKRGGNEGLPSSEPARNDAAAGFTAVAVLRRWEAKRVECISCVCS
jgi:hypothetical protein